MSILLEIEAAGFDFLIDFLETLTHLFERLTDAILIFDQCQSQPAVALLDEPLSGLDPRGIRAARGAIRRLAATGAAVILSSHLLELIEALADRLLIMDHGRAVFEGTLEEARQQLATNGQSSLEELFMAATGEEQGDQPGPERGSEHGPERGQAAGEDHP